ncbi:MAG: hypothetical protein AAF098_07795 [Pseudomonadota bacterium]
MQPPKNEAWRIKASERPDPLRGKEAPGFDRFSQVYLAVLLAALLAAALAYWVSRDERLDGLNQVLRTDKQLQAYPYRFKVLELENRVATVSSPQEAGLSVIHFLRTAFPNLRATAIDDPAIMAAQTQLVYMHHLAESLLKARPEVERVRWEMDERWYREHGVFLESLTY